MSADPRLFEMLAQALSQPSRAYRATQAGLQIPIQGIEGYTEGLQAGNTIRSLKAAPAMAALQAQEARLKPYEIWSNIAKTAGPDRANAVFQQAGMPVPSMGTSSPGTETPDQLANMGEYGSTKLGAQEKALTLKNNAPFSPEVATFINNGDLAGLGQYHASKGEQVPYREVTAAISAKRPNMMGGYFNARAGSLQANQLPSQAPVGDAAGAAYQVKVAARQGKTLIANATSPQNLALASVDLSRAVQRAAPVSETIGAGNYAQSLPTILNQLQQKITSDPNGPDVPKLRKQLYDTFDELDKAATPWIANRLQNMEDNNLNSTYGDKWSGVKQRELGLTTPDIPFNAGTSTDTTQGGGGWSYGGPVKQ